MNYSDQEKLAEINREIEMRHRVYRWQVRNGKLTAEQARRQIDIMIAIKLDYAEKIKSAPDMAACGTTADQFALL